MFSVEMLAAQRGDALWLTYGDPSAPRHALIDAGPRESIATVVPELERRLAGLPSTNGRVDLLTISHVDADHIQGVVSLLSRPGRLGMFDDIWFNGFKHLGTPDTLGAPDGEQLTTLLEQHPHRWNKAFAGAAVVAPTSGDLPTITLDGGLALTLLSPTPTSLARLIPQWQRECEKAGLMPGRGAEVPRASAHDDMLGWDVDVLASAPYRRDRAVPNGSSIAFIAAYDGKRVLFAADAHSEVLEQSLRRLGPGPHWFDAVKVSHHASQANTSPGFLDRVRARHWLISTNGAKFEHPAAQALARIITTQDKPVFHLNYVTRFVSDLIDGAGSRYSVRLPTKRREGGHDEGIVVHLT